jgi:hypothetical protein
MGNPYKTSWVLNIKEATGFPTAREAQLEKGQHKDASGRTVSRDEGCSLKQNWESGQSTSVLSIHQVMALENGSLLAGRTLQTLTAWRYV